MLCHAEARPCCAGAATCHWLCRRPCFLPRPPTPCPARPRTAPLVMSNGRNLIDMVCEAYESPDGGEPVAPKPQRPPAPAARRGRGGGGGGGGRGAAATGKEEQEGNGEEEEEEPESFNFSEGWDGGRDGEGRGVEVSMARAAAVARCRSRPTAAHRALCPCPTRRHLPRAAAAQAGQRDQCGGGAPLWQQVCRCACGRWPPATAQSWHTTMACLPVPPANHLVSAQPQ